MPQQPDNSSWKDALAAMEFVIIQEPATIYNLDGMLTRKSIEKLHTFIESAVAEARKEERYKNQIGVYREVMSKYATMIKNDFESWLEEQCGYDIT